MAMVECKHGVQYDCPECRAEACEDCGQPAGDDGVRCLVVVNERIMGFGIAPLYQREGRLCAACGRKHNAQIMRGR